jgi:hypothetical protein
MMTLWALVTNPWLWVGIALAAGAVYLGLWRKMVFWLAVSVCLCGVLYGLWQGERRQRVSLATQYEQSRLTAVNEALRAQAEGWEAIYAAQSEAVTRMAQEAGVAAANARAWRDRYEAAKQTPECKAWAMQPVNCPIS